MVDQQEPAWIADLRRQQQDAGEIPLEIPLESPQDASVGAPQEQVARPDMLEDLREQMFQAEDDITVAEASWLPPVFRNLEPWQRLLLAVLLFLNVALCGCMGLVMIGRVSFP
jgi:hypothetical protein